MVQSSSKRMAQVANAGFSILACVLACADFVESGDLLALACGMVTSVAAGLATYSALSNAPGAVATAVAAEPKPPREVMAREAMKEALAKEQEENRLKSEFLAHVSHELRTPLNAIINVPAALCQDYETFNAWHCDSCGNDYSPTDEQQVPGGTTETCPECGHTMTMQMRAVYKGDPSEHYRYLRKTQHAAQHLLAVVSDILDFSKLDAGKMTLKKGRTTVRGLVEEVRDTASSLASSKNVVLTWPEIPSDWAVDADALKAAQVLLNLLSNAVKFSPQNGRVFVSCDAAAVPSMMRFAVRDEGAGIPADKVSELFENYRQVDDSSKRAHAGTGLGLVISRKLVELHGGTIGVESVVGQGSTFHFTLPLVAAAPTRDFAGQVAAESDAGIAPAATQDQVIHQQIKRER